MNPSVLALFIALALIALVYIIAFRSGNRRSAVGGATKRTLMQRSGNSLTYSSSPAELWNIEFRRANSPRHEVQLPIAKLYTQNGMMMVTQENGLTNEFALGDGEYAVLTRVQEQAADHMDDDDIRGQITINKDGARFVVDEDRPDLNNGIFWGTDERGVDLAIVAGPGVTMTAERFILP